MGGNNWDKSQTIKRLESERNQLLLKEEALWRQRCRTNWIKCGDLNTKYFHHFTSSCRSKKHIWEIVDAAGIHHRGQEALKTTTVSHFKPFFEEKPSENLQVPVTVARLFPHTVTADDSLTLESPCTLQEILVALKSFSKDKIPGPDGWTVEFYLHFFDLVGPDLLELVEDTRLSGKVAGALNSNFLTLIPKEANPTTFGDYRPIALCNMCYKLISKIIATKINPILSQTLSREQLGFLKGR
jgi:hypothetical protein